MQTRTKLAVDVAMMVGLCFSMSLQLFGAGIHKGIGLLTFLLFFLHNLLNRTWYSSLFRGRYTVRRRIHTATNILVLLGMAGIMASGAMLSRELAAGLGEGMTPGRVLHNLSSYLSCVGIALHIGFHLKRRNNDDA